MSLLLSVKSPEFDSEEFSEEHIHCSEEISDVALQIELENVSVISVLNTCLEKLESRRKIGDFKVLNSDYFLACLENGGEIEAADLDEFYEELKYFEAEDDILNDLAEEEFHLLEDFFSKMNSLMEISLNLEANIEIVNMEEHEALDILEKEEGFCTVEEELETKSEVADDNDLLENVFDKEDSDEIDFDIDPDLEKEFEKEFEQEFEQGFDDE
jgi:hypothetical protein